MDKILLNIMLVHPVWTMLGLTASVVLGGLIASWVLTVRQTHRRVAYLWTTTMIMFGFSVLHIGSAFLPNAVEAGLFSPLYIFLLLTFPALGWFIYWASAARSQHLTGDTSLAWLGFVPVANLWLYLKPGQKDDSRIWLEQGVRDMFVIAAALIPMWLGHEIMDELGETSTRANTIYAFEKHATSVEDAAYFKALDYSRYEKPNVFRGVRVQQAHAEGGTLNLKLQTRRPVQLDPDHMQTQAMLLCNGIRNARFMDAGGQFNVTFAGPTGAVIGQVMASKDSCAT